MNLLERQRTLPMSTIKLPTALSLLTFQISPYTTTATWMTSSNEMRIIWLSSHCSKHPSLRVRDNSRTIRPMCRKLSPDNRLLQCSISTLNKGKVHPKVMASTSKVWKPQSAPKPRTSFSSWSKDK